MQPNMTKAKLKAGETVFGCFVRPNEDKVQKAMGKPDNRLEEVEAGLPFKRLLLWPGWPLTC